MQQAHDKGSAWVCVGSGWCGVRGGEGGGVGGGKHLRVRQVGAKAGATRGHHLSTGQHHDVLLDQLPSQGVDGVLTGRVYACARPGDTK